VDRHFQFNVMERYRRDRQTVESIGNSCRNTLRQAGGWDETRRRESIRHVRAVADSHVQHWLHVDGLGRSVWRGWVQYRMQHRLRYRRLRYLLNGHLRRQGSLVEFETWLWRVRRLWRMWLLRRAALRIVLATFQRDSRSIPGRSSSSRSLPSDADQR
jgi:hypothetical protein